MQDKQKIIEKIAKCMALAKGGNEHEAAAALRQAQKLMQAHNVTSTDMLTAHVDHQKAKAGAQVRPSKWEAILACDVGEIFGCKVLFVERQGYWMFIGFGAAPEVAQYSFDVLLRQARAARKRYIKKYVPYDKSRRADLYCFGWIESAVKSIPTWQSSEDEKAAIKAYINNKWGVVDKKAKSIDRISKRSDALDYMDYLQGKDAGKNAVVNRGMNGQAAPAALTHVSN